jgi:hypothetical protein
MTKNLPKTFKHLLRINRFWPKSCNKNITALYKVVIVLTYCNIELFIVYVTCLTVTFV